MSDGIYTEAECIEAIKSIDQALADLRKAPAQQSIDGNFVSFAGKSSELQSERRQWVLRLRDIRLDGRARHSLQGPDFEV